MSAETAELVAHAPELPEPVMRRGISEAQWRTLANNLFPGAAPLSVLMVWDYCIARKLDPLKKPCHIVPMRVKDAKTGEWGWRDVVMPGIYEYRTTAQRTGEYLGHSKPEYGPIVDHLGVKAPEWCEMAIYRHNKYASDGRAVFPVRRYFVEVVGLTKEGKVNDRWSKAPVQMLEKCTEAAGLREAFPDEFGGEPTAEEMDNQRFIDVEPARTVSPQPAQRRSQQTPGGEVDRGGDRADGHSRETPSTTAGTAGDPTPQAADSKTDTAAPTAAATPADKSCIGVIVDVVERSGGAMVKLSTRFQSATRDAELIEAARKLKASGATVELVTKASSDPSKFAPVLVEIVSASSEAAS